MSQQFPQNLQVFVSSAFYLLIVFESDKQAGKQAGSATT